AREARVCPAVPSDPLMDVSLREVQAVLDEELSRLPGKYRLPLVLCCLEGKSRDEAACCLGLSLASVKTRLEKGRDLLRRRLVRRGLSLSMALATSTLFQGAARAAVPAALVNSTSRTALQALAGPVAADAVSPSVFALIQGGIQTMWRTKLAIASA